MARNFVRASSQYLAVSTGINVGVPCTLAGWFRTTELTNTNTVISLSVSVGSDQNYVLTRGATTDKLTGSSNESGTAFGEAVSGVNPSVDTWHHFTAVFAATNDRRIYLDGVRGTDNTTTVTIPVCDVVALGVIGFPISNYWSGDLARCAAWSVALGDADAASLAKGIAPRRIRPQSLVDYWPLIGRNTNENGLKGHVMVNNGTTVAEHPRSYGF